MVTQHAIRSVIYLCTRNHFRRFCLLSDWLQHTKKVWLRLAEDTRIYAEDGRGRGIMQKLHISTSVRLPKGTVRAAVLGEE